MSKGSGALDLQVAAHGAHHQILGVFVRLVPAHAYPTQIVKPRVASERAVGCFGFLQRLPKILG